MGAAADPGPSALAVVIGCLDPVELGGAVQLAQDLSAEDPRVTPNTLADAARYIDDLLSDPDTPTSDIKGLLNRLAGKMWGLQFGFGPQASDAHLFLQAVRDAIRVQTQ